MGGESAATEYLDSVDRGASSAVLHGGDQQIGFKAVNAVTAGLLEQAHALGMAQDIALEGGGDVVGEGLAGAGGW